MSVFSKVELADYLLVKAHEVYSDSLLLFEAGRYSSAANRLYYAIYHTVRALFTIDEVIAKDGKKIKGHDQVVGKFNHIYVHQNEVFPKAFARFIKKAESLRVDGDYMDMVVVDSAELQGLIVEFPEFYGKVKEYVATQST